MYYTAKPHFCIRGARGHGEVYRDLTDQDLANPRIRGLLPKIALEEDPEMTLWGNAVLVRFRDGSTDQHQILLPKGDPENPMTWEDTETKFMKLTDPLGNAPAGRRIVEAVRTLERSDGAILIDAIDALARSARR